MNILFSLRFNVEVGRTAYRSFIEDLRKRLAGDRVSHGRPVLPHETKPVTERFEIVLETTNADTSKPPTPHPKEIRLLFRRHNLYLDAYSMGKTGIWLEFSEPNQKDHLIAGSTFLGFHGGYSGIYGLQNTAGRTREAIPLGRDPLKNAVNHLAASYDNKVRAESLIVVIQMICESIRFEEITKFLLEYYLEGNKSATPTPHILILENNWGTLSNALLRSDARPDPPVFPIRVVENGKQYIITAEQAVAEIGILLFDEEGIKK